MKKEDTGGKLKLTNVVEGIKLSYHFLISKWKTIVIFGVIGGILGFTYAFVKKPIYKAVLTFALEEKGSSMSSYANIASQLGMDIGGGLNGGGGALVGENLLELLKSRFLVEKTLLSEVEIKGKKDLLVNLYIQFNEIDKSWEKNPEKKVSYIVNQPRNKFSQEQDSLLFRIYENIEKGDLMVRKVDKKLNIVIVEYQSIDEIFAKYFSTELVKNASEFYIETKTKKTRSNVVLLQNRLDSVKTALDQLMYTAAANQDRNQNPSKAQSKVPLMKQQMDIQILSTMYGELIKNLEMSKFTLMREEPLVQVIDKPILPLEKTKPGKIKSVIAGGFLFGFFTILFLLLNRTYKKIMYIESTENV